MMSTRSVRSILWGGLVLFASPACTSALINTPVSNRAEGWNVTLTQLKDGPDEYPGENVVFTPNKDERFLWALVTVRSEHGDEQMFENKACVLEAKGVSRQPMIIDKNDKNPEIFATADDTESFDAGQERVRRLIFSFPKNQRPTRLKCGSLALPIPPK